MRRLGSKPYGAVALLATLIACFAVVPSASADRRPTNRERSAIKRVGLDACGQTSCRFHRARVSTRNPRYAWAKVIGEGFSGVLVRRPTRRSRRWRVIGIQGGGIAECSYWERRAPDRVLRDLRIRGLVASGDVRTCG